MQIIASNILADMCELSLGLILLVLAVGFVLWLFGWWSHRFWIVLTTTVLAGIVGLTEASDWRAQPMVVAVLLAVAAGVLALALVRVIAFLCGGIGGLYLFQVIYPSQQQPIIAFLVCGLLSLLLFRWCFMALTSLLGSALLAYAILTLLHYYEFLNAERWSEEHSLMLNSLCGAGMLIGFVWQLYLHRRQIRLRRLEEAIDGRGPVATILNAVGGRFSGHRHAA